MMRSVSAQRLSHQLTSTVASKKSTTGFHSAYSLIASGKSEPCVRNCLDQIPDHGSCCSYRAQPGTTATGHICMDGILGKCDASVVHPDVGRAILQVAVNRDRAKSLSQVLPRRHLVIPHSWSVNRHSVPPSTKYRGNSRGPRR